MTVTCLTATFVVGYFILALGLLFGLAAESDTLDFRFAERVAIAVFWPLSLLLLVGHGCRMLLRRLRGARA